MRSAMALIASVCLMCLVDGVSLAQQFRHTLRGAVKLDANIEPTPVRIQLVKSGVTLQETFSRDNRFEFANVEGGGYTLIVSAPGYETVQHDVTVPDDWPLIELRPPRNATRPTEAVPVWALKIPETARRHFEAAKKNILDHNCVAALAHLRKAIQAYAEFGPAHQAMGDCHTEMNHLETAEQEFKLALEQPHAPELHLRLAQLYEQQGNRAQQARQLTLYIEEKPHQQKVIR